MSSRRFEYWTVTVSLAGAFLWAVLAGFAGAGRTPLGVIELLFLFAPLVTVPLGLRLAEVLSPSPVPQLGQITVVTQPLAAACVVMSFLSSPGKIAGVLALPWFLTCVLAAISGALGLVANRKSVSAIVANVARIDLAVGGGWLLLTRLGARPLGFQEPIVLLTAVHFHYSGFATALIAAAVLRSHETRGAASTLLRTVAPSVAALPFAVAAGFVWSPAFKVAAVVAFSLSILLLAIILFRDAARFRSRTARALTRISSASVFAGMSLAVTYAVGDYLHRDWLLIPRMASTHGLLNGFGFVMLGLLGWLVELHSPATRASTADTGVPRTYGKDPVPVRPAIPPPSPDFVAREFHDW
jgi:hypothetical protein